MKAVAMKSMNSMRPLSRYKKVVDDEEDDDASEDDTHAGQEETESSKGFISLLHTKFGELTNFLMFNWLRKLLELGNQRPLEQDDLYDLKRNDRAINIYKIFAKNWKHQLHKTKPSLVITFIESYGLPFILVGFLKLIHDICLFLGPYLLNKIIVFLNDTEEPISTGLKYVLYLFLINLIMSLCLRQYFWYVIECD